MLKEEKLKLLIDEAQILLNRLVNRFEKYNHCDMVNKKNELKIAAEHLNEQLLKIALPGQRFCTTEEIELADDIVFQLSIFDDICYGFLEGL